MHGFHLKSSNIKLSFKKALVFYYEGQDYFTACPAFESANFCSYYFVLSRPYVMCCLVPEGLYCEGCYLAPLSPLHLFIA